MTENETQFFNDLPEKYMLLYIDYRTNYISRHYFAIKNHLGYKEACHIIYTGKIVYECKYQLN